VSHFRTRWRNSLQAVLVVMPSAVAGAEAALSHISAADDKVGSIGILGQAASKACLHNCLHANYLSGQTYHAQHTLDPRCIQQYHTQIVTSPSRIKDCVCDKSVLKVLQHVSLGACLCCSYDPTWSGAQESKSRAIEHSPKRQHLTGSCHASMGQSMCRHVTTAWCQYSPGCHSRQC